jgi:hypothetical protein
MAFGHGSAAKAFGAGTDLTGFINSVTSSKSADTAETSTLGSDSKSYVAGLADATVAIEGFWTGDVDAIDEMMEEALGVAGSVVTHWPQGDALGARGKAGAAINSSYEVSTSVDDAGTISGEFQASGGLDAVLSLVPKALKSSDDEGTGIDNGAASSAGGQGYLHVFDVTGGTGAIVKVQDSVDDAVYTDLITFATVSAGSKGGEKLSVTGTVKRWVKGEWVVGGGTATIALSFARN